MFQSASVLISKDFRWPLRFALFLGCLVIALGFGGWIAASQVQGVLHAALASQNDHYVQVRESVEYTLEKLDSELTAPTCSDEYLAQMRRVAYLPDGFSQFLKLSGTRVECGINVAESEAGYELGDADLAQAERRIWLDQGLDFLGLDGIQGHVVARGDLALVVSYDATRLQMQPWIDYELQMRGATGPVMSRQSSPKVPSLERAEAVPLVGDMFYDRVCDADGPTCIVGQVAIGRMIADAPLPWLSSLASIVLIAVLFTTIAEHLLQRRMAFPARFRRHFNARSIVCLYQPILRVSDRTIAGCEVLVRWRDIDGRIVMPDEFLPVVEQLGLTRQMTGWVAERAHAELSKALPMVRNFRVNLNIFPADLEAGFLIEQLAVFSREPGRFRPVVEIVETGMIDVENACTEIAQLRRGGIETYLDDFGAGFCNIQSLAFLPLDGVKLDRSFAMASEDSLMDKLLPTALRMVAEGNWVTVVEGVETPARLEMLCASGKVTYLQGFLIGRPMPAEDLARLVSTPADGPRVVPQAA